MPCFYGICLLGKLHRSQFKHGLMNSLRQSGPLTKTASVTGWSSSRIVRVSNGKQYCGPVIQLLLSKISSFSFHAGLRKILIAIASDFYSIASSKLLIIGCLTISTFNEMLSVT